MKKAEGSSTDSKEDSVKSLIEVQIDNIHCLPQVYQASLFIKEVYQLDYV